MSTFSFTRCFRHAGRVATAAIVAAGTSALAQEEAPKPGMHTFTRAKAMNANPPQRAGGPVEFSVPEQKTGARFILPGTRKLDPAIFNTPEQPSGFEPAPFPMLGIPLGKEAHGEPWRMTHDDSYTIVNHFSPFSDWYEETEGTVRMTLRDVTAIDGKRTEDEIDFEANFELPDGAKYRVVVKKPLPHGGAFPFFGGVVTNHLIHGGAGIAPRLLPTKFAYAAFWGMGNVYKDGSLINEGQLVHVWVSEKIRGEGDRLRLDHEAGRPSEGTMVSMVVPPYKPVPGKGMVKTPLKTMFMPFPYVKPNIMREMKMAKEAGDEARIAEVEQIQHVAQNTKAHVVKATAAGKMFGMPFIHMKFDDVSINVK